MKYIKENFSCWKGYVDDNGFDVGLAIYYNSITKLQGYALQYKNFAIYQVYSYSEPTKLEL